MSTPKELERFVERSEAPELFDYVELGGILRIETKPLRVIYPSRKIVGERIRELEERRKELIREMAKVRRIKNRKRLLDPLKIKHAILKAVDPEYRELAEAVEVERLLEDERGRKIVEELQRNKEYREKVRLTLQNSPVYRNRKFGDFVEKTEEVKGNLIDGRLKRLEEALKKTEREIEVLRRLLKWTR